MFLPLVSVTFHDALGEPNDICEQAYFLETGVPYQFLPEDQQDWYRFEVEESSQLTIRLSNFAPIKGQIAVYRGASCEVAAFLGNNGDPGSTKVLTLGVQPPGPYLLFVSNDGSLSTSQWYTLIIEAE